MLDTPGVENLVSTLMLNKSILEDLKQYNEARRDHVSTCYDQIGFLFLVIWAIMTHIVSTLKFPWIPVGDSWRIIQWEVEEVRLEDGSKKRKTKETGV